MNERPAGVARNAARGEATWTLNLRVQKQFGLGSRQAGNRRGRVPGRRWFPRRWRWGTRRRCRGRPAAWSGRRRWW